MHGVLEFMLAERTLKTYTHIFIALDFATRRSSLLYRTETASPFIRGAVQCALPLFFNVLPPLLVCVLGHWTWRERIKVAVFHFALTDRRELLLFFPCG
jgi:hypothetical protein